MYVKHDFLMRSIEAFTSRQKKLKLINAVRDNYKVIDTAAYPGANTFDHNGGNLYKNTTITPTCIFHMWPFWDDTDCTLGLVDNSSRIRPIPADGDYRVEKAREFYKALGTDALTLCRSMNSNKGAVIAHFKLDPAKYTVSSPSADAAETYKYINTRSTLGQWEECTLKYSRTKSASYSYYNTRTIEPTFDDLKDDSIVELLLNGGYLVQDPSLSPTTSLSLKEKKAYGDLTPDQLNKLTALWHNSNLSAVDPHELLAFTILDDGTIFDKEASVLTRTIREDWVQSYNYTDATDGIKVYTLEVILKYRFRRKVHATSSNVTTIVDQLQNFQYLQTSWVDTQVNDMLKLNNFSLSDLCLGFNYVVSDGFSGDTSVGTKWYVSVEKFDAMAESNPELLYDVLAGTTTTASIIDVFVETEKASFLVKFFTFVVTAVAIVVSAIYQQWWVIPLITAVYAVATYTIAKYGKMADAMVVGKFATMYTTAASIISFMTAPANKAEYAMSQEAVDDMTFAEVEKSAFGKMIDNISNISLSNVLDTGLSYVTNGLIDYAKMGWGEITVRVMGLTNNLINAYLHFTTKPLPADVSAETPPVVETVEYYDTLFTISDDYTFCEINQQMELLPYEMTQGFVDKTTSKYYNAM